MTDTDWGVAETPATTGSDPRLGEVILPGRLAELRDGLSETVSPSVQDRRREQVAEMEADLRVVLDTIADIDRYRYHGQSAPCVLRTTVPLLDGILAVKQADLLTRVESMQRDLRLLRSRL